MAGFLLLRPSPVAVRTVTRSTIEGAIAPSRVLRRCYSSARGISTSTASREPGVDFPGPPPSIPPESTTQKRWEAIKRAKPFSEFLTDTFRRQHDYLRISVTERCNLRCLYCMPEEGVPDYPKDELLTSPEIFYLSSLFVSQGVTKIRLTGGEPTVRRDIVPLVKSIGSLRSNGLRELCLTTNGVTLRRKLKDMVEAGLTGVNISLDTLDPHLFQIMTRRKGFDAVMRTIDELLGMNRHGAGIKLKINCVVMRHLNKQEIPRFVEFVRDKDIEVRFIEYMPFDDNKWSQGKMYTYGEMLDDIREKYPSIRKVRGHRNDTSKTYEIPGFVGKIGFITSMTHNFCGTCNRLRITSDGKIKVCLFDQTEVSLRDLLREGNCGRPIGTEAFEEIRKAELDRHQGLISDKTPLGWGEREQELLEVIGVAVKNKKAKHAGMGELENLKNRPMILIGSRKIREPDPVRHWQPSLHPNSLLITPTSTPFHILSPLCPSYTSARPIHVGRGTRLPIPHPSRPRRGCRSLSRKQNILSVIQTLTRQLEKLRLRIREDYVQIGRISAEIQARVDLEIRRREQGPTSAQIGWPAVMPQPVPEMPPLPTTTAASPSAPHLLRRERQVSYPRSLTEIRRKGNRDGGLEIRKRLQRLKAARSRGTEAISKYFRAELREWGRRRKRLHESVQARHRQNRRKEIMFKQMEELALAREIQNAVRAGKFSSALEKIQKEWEAGLEHDLETFSPAVLSSLEAPPPEDVSVAHEIDRTYLLFAWFRVEAERMANTFQSVCAARVRQYRRPPPKAKRGLLEAIKHRTAFLAPRVGRKMRATTMKSWSQSWPGLSRSLQYKLKWDRWWKDIETKLKEDVERWQILRGAAGLDTPRTLLFPTRRVRSRKRLNNNSITEHDRSEERIQILQDKKDNKATPPSQGHSHQTLKQSAGQNTEASSTPDLSPIIRNPNTTKPQERAIAEQQVQDFELPSSPPTLPQPPAWSLPAPQPTHTPPSLTHVSEQTGRSTQVNVSNKPLTKRTAIAVSSIRFSNPTAYELLLNNALKKGDALSEARTNGIGATKWTSQLIRLCHNIMVTYASCEVSLVRPGKPPPWPHLYGGGVVARNPLEFGGVIVECQTQTVAPTGVEMEALTGASVAALTLYDMCKAVDKHMVIDGARVVLKTGGKSGDWKEEGWRSLVGGEDQILREAREVRGAIAEQTQAINFSPKTTPAYVQEANQASQGGPEIQKHDSVRFVLGSTPIYNRKSNSETGELNPGFRRAHRGSKMEEEPSVSKVRFYPRRGDTTFRYHAAQFPSHTIPTGDNLDARALSKFTPYEAVHEVTEEKATGEQQERRKGYKRIDLRQNENGRGNENTLNELFLWHRLENSSQLNGGMDGPWAGEPGTFEVTEEEKEMVKGFPSHQQIQAIVSKWRRGGLREAVKELEAKRKQKSPGGDR